MAEWGSPLPENLQWVKGSPYIWYEFWHEGNRFRGSTKTDILKGAKDRLAVERNKAVTGDYKKEENTLTLDEAFAEWWLVYGQFLKSATRSVKQHLEHLLLHLKPHTMLHEVDGAMLSAYVAASRKEKHKGHGWKKAKPTSPANINRRLSTFQGVHRMAWEIWGVKVKPIAFKKLKLDEPDPIDNTLTAQEAAQYMENAEPHLIDYLMIDLYAGPRKGNILSLRGKQIDIEKKEITVWGKSKKKEGKKIVIPIQDELLHYIIANGIHLRDWVITYRGKPIKDIVTAHEGALRRAGIEKKVRPHDLRHTCGTWLYAKTKDIKLVKDWLGHSSYATTERYVHSDTETKLDTANKADMPSFRHIKRVK